MPKNRGSGFLHSPIFYRVNRFGSELVGQTNAGVERRDLVEGVVRRGIQHVGGGENEVVGKTAGLLRIGYTRIEVHVPGEPPIEGDREHINRSGAT